MQMSISPRDWDLTSSNHEDPAYAEGSGKLRLLGLDKADLERRSYENTYHWLMRQFREDIGAFSGFYDPRTRTFNEPQTANLIAPWQLLAAYDRYGDEDLLQKAKRALDWLNANMVDSHPMSFVLGGVRDNIKETQLWTKYTADYVVSNLGIYHRTSDEVYLGRAIQSGKFLLQAQRHGFCPKYDHYVERWIEKGWQSFGRVVIAMLSLFDATGDEQWQDWAIEWAEYGVTLQFGDGCFYLVNDDYYNTDMVADELRALVRLSRQQKRRKFLNAGVRFADWHLQKQRSDGSWWLNVDRFGVPVSEYIGPGDVPNLAISLLMVHQETGDIRYLCSAVRALRYSLGVQATPESGDPYLDDPNIVWGFWSWDPYYDYTMSSDQSTHHIRGYWFFLDYFFSLSSDVQDRLVELEPAGEADEGGEVSAASSVEA